MVSNHRHTFMDLKLFFSPVSEEIYQDISSISSCYKSINIFAGTMPDLKDHDIALIGLTDPSGAEDSRPVRM